MSTLDREALEASVADILETWAQPPDEMINQIPKGGKQLDYMGHAWLTIALLQIDPEWDYQPVRDQRGLPIIETHGDRFVMWGQLTINGVTRWCVATCAAKKSEPEKELVGDALRNGALRFGIATKLWTKTDDADPAGNDGTGRRPQEPEYVDPERVERARTVYREIGELSDELKSSLKEWGKDGSFKVADMAADDDWLTQVESWLDEHRAADVQADPT